MTRHPDIPQQRLSAFYAFDRQGALRHISQVERGLACGCLCRDCGDRLVARQGDVRVHHFAHESGNACTSADHEFLRAIARHLVADNELLQLPAITHIRETLVDPRLIPCRLQRSAPIAAEPEIDLQIALGDGHHVDLSFRIGRRLPKARVAALIEAERSSLEIDISGLRDIASLTRAAQHVLHQAPRKWSCVSPGMLRDLHRIPRYLPPSLMPEDPFYDLVSSRQNRLLGLWHARKIEFPPLPAPGA